MSSRIRGAAVPQQHTGAVALADRRGAADLDGPVELAPRVWWVGSLVPGDQFQCHVYLIDQGDQSVLIDPGSALGVHDLIRKINAVVGLDHVRYLVCSHADPDIIGALPALVAAGLHPDAVIVTHWRNEALIRHSGTPLPYWRIEDHGWRLPLPDRELQFVFTPYAHFAGAFCTFDAVSGTLFSSDLYGGFSDDHTLFASSVDDFDNMREFHEHYMPSGDILGHSLERLRELPLVRIAPQHGHVIPQELIGPITDRLAGLQCGIYLLARDDPGLEFLLKASHSLGEVVKTLVAEAQFPVIARRLTEIAGDFLGTTGLQFWAQAGPSSLQFDPTDEYSGHPAEPPPIVERGFEGSTTVCGTDLVVPLLSSSSRQVIGVALLEFPAPPVLDAPTEEILRQIAELIEVGLEREVMRRIASLDRDTFYELATHDQLTRLYNRAYVAEVAGRLCAIDDRDDSSQLAALMIDLDHFKNVNDTFGHATGDLALQHVAQSMTRVMRPSDVAARLGGEEFLVMLAGVDVATAVAVGERVRAAIATADGFPASLTASVGIALRERGETFESLVRRADAALYRAKAGGRDRVDLAA